MGGRAGPDDGRPLVERTRTGEYEGLRIEEPSSMEGRYCTKTAC